MDVADRELERMVERRSRNGEMHPDEREEIWKASVRAYTARQRAEIRAERVEYHRGQAVRLRTVLGALIAPRDAGREPLRNRKYERSLKMATDPTEIPNRRNAEVAKIRGFVDLTDGAKQRRIAEVSEKARAEYAEALEAGERERAERLQRTERAVFRVPVSSSATDAEEAQIHAAFRSAYADVYNSIPATEGPEQVQGELERLLQQAERTGDKLLARAVYHRGIDLGAQAVVDAYLTSRPSENRAWEAYTEAHRDAN